MQKRTLVVFGIIIILLGVVLVIYAMRPTASPPQRLGGISLPPSAQPSQSPSQEFTSPPSSVSVKDFSITAKQWEFYPSTIRVALGERVRLVITSTDVTHGFAIPDFNINVSLMPNETKTVEFVADKQGTFGFFCSIFCGSGHANMSGRLVVE